MPGELGARGGAGLLQSTLGILCLRVGLGADPRGAEGGGVSLLGLLVCVHFALSGLARFPLFVRA